MSRNDNRIFEKLKDLTEHSGYVIFSIDDYFVQCFSGKGEAQIDVEAVSHYRLPLLSESLSMDFARLGFKIDEDLADGNYVKSYKSSFANQNIQSVISDVLEIFDNIYNVQDDRNFEITDSIDYPDLVKVREEKAKRLRRGNRNSILWFGLFIALITGAIYFYVHHKSGSPRNKRAISLSELNAIQVEDEMELDKHTAKRDRLTAAELIELADCSDLSCVQLYMKDKGPDFVYARKGEYAAQHRDMVKDTAGNELRMPLSTFYTDVSGQAAQWRAAHTLHSKMLADSLYNEFMGLGFTFVEEGKFLGIKNRQRRYISQHYPGKSLYVTATFQPWYLKGLYNRPVTWFCWVFEVYKDN